MCIYYLLILIVYNILIKKQNYKSIIYQKMLNQNTKKGTKSQYIPTSWFQNVTDEQCDDIIKKWIQISLFKLEIEFNAYGMLQPMKYLDDHKEKLIKILTYYQEKLTYFKFKFVGWQNHQVKLQEFLNPIHENINADFITINFSKFNGSEDLFIKIIKIFFMKKCKSLALHFGNWQMNYNTIKKLTQGGIVITNELENFHLDLSGWGADIDYFFNLPKKRSKSKTYEQDKQKLINECKSKLKTFFKEEIVSSVTHEIILDLRNWHKDFKLQELKKQLSNQMKNGAAQMASMFAYMKSSIQKPIFKFNFII